MKAIKRTVAALLATLMLATSTSFTLAAEEYSDAEAVVVAKVNAAGIMTGTDKGFEPSKSLTRAEAAAIIVRMKGISESAVKSAAGTTLFTDVAASHWASGYVNQASNLGIVKGVSATEFAPDREVTIAEFTTMAIRALGAGQLVDSEGTWPTNYVNFANEEGILDDVNAVYTATASRLQAATIVANTLEANMWAKTAATTKAEITYTETDKTILEDVLNIVVYEDVTLEDLIASDRTATVRSTTEKDKVDPSKFVAYLSNVDVAKVVDYASLKLGMVYDVWFDDDTDEIVGVWSAEDSKTKTVEFTEIKKVGTETAADRKAKFVVDGSEKEYTFEYKSGAFTANVYYNGAKQTAGDLAKVVESPFLFGTIVLDGSKVQTIYVYEYKTIGLVDEVTDTRIKFRSSDLTSVYASKQSTSFKKDDKDVTYYVEKDGKEVGIEGIEEDDVILFYTVGSEYHITVITDSVEGEVTAQGNDYIRIDGTKYTMAKGFACPAVESDLILYLNDSNKVIAYETVEETGKYAIVKQLEVVNGRKGLDVEVVLAYADGTTSDAMVVDYEECDANYNAINLITGSSATTADAQNTAIKTTPTDSILGTLVDYEIKGGELGLKAVKATDKEAIATAKVVISSSKKYITGGTKTFYFDDNTKVMILKANKDAYKVTVSTVDASTVEQTSDLKLEVADIDNDNNVGLIIVDQRAAGAKALKTTNATEDFLTLVSVESIKDDDYKISMNFADVDGKEYSYKYNATSSPIALGTTGVVSVTGDEYNDIDQTDYKVYDGLTSANKAPESGYTAGSIYVYGDANGILKLVRKDTKDSSDPTYKVDELVLSENVLYVKKDSATKFAVSSDSKLNEVEYVDSTYNFTDANSIDSIVLEKDSDGNTEVVVIIFNK